MIGQRCIQQRPSEAGDERATAQGPSGSGHSSLPLHDIIQKVGDLLWAEHVIRDPCGSDAEGKAGCGEAERQSGSEESWRNHTTSPPDMQNAQLLCQDEEEEEEEEEEGDNGWDSIQEDKLSTGSDDTELHPDSPLSCRVRAAWRRWLSLWLKRKYTSKTNSEEPSRKPFSGFWRWLTLRHLLLQAGSGHPHLVATGDRLHTCQPLQPCFMCSPFMLRNRCFLDDGELVVPPHGDGVAGRPFLETSPVELPASDASQRAREGESNRDEDRAPGSCNVFRALRRHTAPELRLHFGEESDSDLQELLVEDEDDADGAADTH